MKTLHLIIASPEEVVYEGDVQSLTLTSSTGEISILPNHIPLVSTLEIGHISVIDTDGLTRIHAVDGGVVQKESDNQVVILSHHVNPLETLDETKVQEAIARAEDQMARHKDNPDAYDYSNIQRVMNRELNRSRLLRKK